MFKFEVISNMTAVASYVIPSNYISKEYATSVVTGLKSFVVVSVIDRLCRAIFLNKVSTQQQPTTTGIGSAIAEEILYSVLLQSYQYTSSFPTWAKPVIAIGRFIASFGTMSTAVRGACHISGHNLQGNSGLSLDNKVGLIWAASREGALQMLPPNISTPALMLTDSLVFGLCEVCPSQQSNFSAVMDPRVARYKFVSGFAFRIIAYVSSYFGGPISPFIQHCMFNISRYYDRN